MNFWNLDRLYLPTGVTDSIQFSEHLAQQLKLWCLGKLIRMTHRAISRASYLTLIHWCSHTKTLLCQVHGKWVDASIPTNFPGHYNFNCCARCARILIASVTALGKYRLPGLQEFIVILAPENVVFLIRSYHCTTLSWYTNGLFQFRIHLHLGSHIQGWILDYMWH